MKSKLLKAVALISCITGAVHAAETITVQPRDNGASAALPAQAADTVSSMAIGGQWAYRFDPEDKHLADGWAQALVAEGATELPGTTDTRGLGPVNSESSEIHLTRAYKYRGAVWFNQ